MIEEKILISSKDEELNDALKKIDEHIERLKLGKKDALHLRLISEEMLGMMNSLTGRYRAFMWYERSVKEAKVFLTAKTDNMDIDAKKGLLSVSSSGKNVSTKGFMGKIGDIIENGLLNFENIMEIEQKYGGGYMGYANMGSMSADSVLAWSLSQYRNSLNQELEGEAGDEWDELEKSIVASIAKDVIVGVKKTQVDMTVIVDIKE